jgi:hypothetical protein
MLNRVRHDPRLSDALLIHFRFMQQTVTEKIMRMLCQYVAIVKNAKIRA